MGPRKDVGVGSIHYIIVLAKRDRQDKTTLENEPLLIKYCEDEEYGKDCQGAHWLNCKRKVEGFEWLTIVIV